jgi:hypothetical protein
MSYRVFSDNKIVSYSDYINKKKCYKKIDQKRYINSYSTFLNLKQNCINNCYSIYPCIKSPMTLIQGTTSYICDNNIPENNTCKITKQTLYPYGYYLCKNNVCNTCVNEAAET